MNNSPLMGFYYRVKTTLAFPKGIQDKAYLAQGKLPSGCFSKSSFGLFPLVRYTYYDLPGFV